MSIFTIVLVVIVLLAAYRLYQGKKETKKIVANWDVTDLQEFANTPQFRIIWEEDNESVD
jgi:hypothetical protein